MLRAMLPYLIAQIPTIGLAIIGMILDARQFTKMNATLDNVDATFDRIDACLVRMLSN